MGSTFFPVSQSKSLSLRSHGFKQLTAADPHSFSIRLQIHFPYTSVFAISNKIHLTFLKKADKMWTRDLKNVGSLLSTQQTLFTVL